MIFGYMPLIKAFSPLSAVKFHFSQLFLQFKDYGELFSLSIIIEDVKHLTKPD